MHERKLLALLGSPHPRGTAASMLACAVKAAEQAGWSVEQVHLYGENIAFCKGCRACLKTRRCAQEDAIQRISALLRACDAVVLAAPVYWANVPAVVKNLFDRLLGVAMEETSTFPKPLLSGKKYMLLTSCHTPFPFSWMFGQSRGAIRCMDEFFKTAGFRCVGKLVCANAAGGKELPQKLRKRIARCWNRI